MKVTTKVTQHYFEFDPKTGADYYALVAAKNRAEAIRVYLRDVSDPAMESDVDCTELTSAVAWKRFEASDDVEGEIPIEYKLEEFEDSGVILWPMELIS